MSSATEAEFVSIFHKVGHLWPELALFAGTCVAMVMGLSPAWRVRRATAGVAGVALLAAGALALWTTPEASGPWPHLPAFIKMAAAGVGLLLLLFAAGTVDRGEEALIAAGHVPFDPLRTTRAEFYSFFLFSIMGLMLCAGADDLVWLFLALELTSLPTYVMVAISQPPSAGTRAQEAGVKYFFLGALGTAIILYGFALLYGATGTTHLAGIAEAFEYGIGPMALAGLLLAILGAGFKIAAVPMHLYVPDVYEGAAAPVGAFLAFVPKTAGFVALALLLGAVGWVHGPGHALPEPLRLTLWVMAAATMTWGNTLALLQNNVKRILAYSSIAHSGYMLVGMVAGPGGGEGITRNGIAAVLFYLVAYGVMNLGAFAVPACLERRGPGGEAREIETVEDLRGLCITRPLLGWTMVLCAASLLGMPPLIGFWAKVPLFTSAISAGEIALVIVLGLNSAAAALYYLRLVAYPLLEAPTAGAWPASPRPPEPTPFGTRVAAAGLAAAGVVLMAVFGNWLMAASATAGRPDQHEAEEHAPSARGTSEAQVHP